MKSVKQRTRYVWADTPAGSVFGRDWKEGTKEHFEKVWSTRSRVEFPWLFELLPISSCRGKSVLELGCGAGYDAYEFCLNGADYFGLDLTRENPRRTRTNLRFFHFAPPLVEADAEDLPFRNEVFDFVFSNGVLHHTPDIQKSFHESFRVLRRGGELWVTLYHKQSIFYWISLFLVDHILRFGFLKTSFEERLSMIEYTSCPEKPLVRAYTSREVKRNLRKVGFSVEQIWVRKLTKEDLPVHLPVLWRLWRYVPSTLMAILEKRFGWYLIVRASRT
jgi:SAM-dependent methyltransferase